MFRTPAQLSTPSCLQLGRPQHAFPLEPQRPAIARPYLTMEPITLAPYGKGDRHAAFGLLHELPILYPGGDQWLEARLQDVLAGKAECTMAKVDNRAVGILIGTPKGKRRIKLSTIYVHPHYRRQHVATSLLDMSWSRWIQRGIESATVTVRHNRLDSLARTLAPYGFDVVRIEKNRYGEGRDEAILISTPRGS
jgi:ribosomal protein S18 acetylase RimI-like enzyme